MTPAFKKALEDYEWARKIYYAAWDKIAKRVSSGLSYSQELTADCREKFLRARDYAAGVADLLLSEERARVKSSKGKKHVHARGPDGDACVECGARWGIVRPGTRRLGWVKKGSRGRGPRRKGMR